MACYVHGMCYGLYLSITPHMRILLHTSTSARRITDRATSDQVMWGSSIWILIFVPSGLYSSLASCIYSPEHLGIGSPG